MAATINPSGIEISAAICLWASGLAMRLDGAVVPDRRLLARVGASAVAMAQVRIDSLLWLALIVLTLLAAARRDDLARIARDRVAWMWGAIVALACLLELGGSCISRRWTWRRMARS